MAQSKFTYSTNMFNLFTATVINGVFTSFFTLIAVFGLDIVKNLGVHIYSFVGSAIAEFIKVLTSVSNFVESIWYNGLFSLATGKALTKLLLDLLTFSIITTAVVFSFLPFAAIAALAPILFATALALMTAEQVFYTVSNLDKVLASLINGKKLEAFGHFRQAALHAVLGALTGVVTAGVCTVLIVFPHIAAGIYVGHAAIATAVTTGISTLVLAGMFAHNIYKRMFPSKAKVEAEVTEVKVTAANDIGPEETTKLLPPKNQAKLEERASIMAWKKFEASASRVAYSIGASLWKKADATREEIAPDASSAAGHTTFSSIPAFSNSGQ